MDIQELTELKEAASAALAGRKKLQRLHDKYMHSLHSKSATRARTTTYNAKTADIMSNEVEPNEAIILGIINGTT